MDPPKLDASKTSSQAFQELFSQLAARKFKADNRAIEFHLARMRSDMRGHSAARIAKSANLGTRGKKIRDRQGIFCIGVANARRV